MKKYYSLPFEFDKLITPNMGPTRLSLEDAIHSNIQFLIFSRVEDFAFDRSMGFEIWDYDRNVFYREKSIYYEEESNTEFKGTLEHGKAKQFFTQNLKKLVVQNEPRLEHVEAMFTFKRLKGKNAKFQRQIVIEVKGRVKKTGESLNPPVKIKILYSPFKVETK